MTYEATLHKDSRVHKPAVWRCILFSILCSSAGHSPWVQRWGAARRDLAGWFRGDPLEAESWHGFRGVFFETGAVNAW